MREYQVRIEERLVRWLTVSAASSEDAFEKASSLWRSGEVVLDASDFTHATVRVDGCDERDL